MSGKVQKHLRRQQAQAMTCDASWHEDARQAKYISVRLMPLIPLIAMVFMSSQGDALVSESYRAFRNIWTVGGLGCAIYLGLWWLDVFLLKHEGWEVGCWKWFGLLPPVGFVYLLLRARYTDKDYVFAIVYFLIKAVSVAVIGPALFI